MSNFVYIQNKQRRRESVRTSRVRISYFLTSLFYHCFRLFIRRGAAKLQWMGDYLRFSGVKYFSSGCFTGGWRELFSSFIVVYTECDAERSSETIGWAGWGGGGAAPRFECYWAKKDGCMWDLELRFSLILFELCNTNRVNRVQSQTNIFPKKTFILYFWV